MTQSVFFLLISYTLIVKRGMNLTFTHFLVRFFLAIFSIGLNTLIQSDFGSFTIKVLPQLLIDMTELGLLIKSLFLDPFPVFLPLSIPIFFILITNYRTSTSALPRFNYG